MASLKDIRRRIGSVKNTQQITKAMKVVAASKLRRAQQAIAGARPYAEKLEELTGRILGEIMESYASVEESKRAALLSKLHPLLKIGGNADSDAKKRVALLVTSSDRGLCGAYNTNIIRYAYRRHKELAALPNTEVTLFFAGKRAYEFFLKRGLSGHLFTDTWTGRFSTKKSDVIATQLVSAFLSGEFDRVEICFTEFKTALSQVPLHKQILPLSVEVGAPTSVDNAAPFIYEPERREILGTLLPNQVKTQIYRALAESLASELASRMAAMDNATRNASEMISSLTLEANRVRQASITTELMEIIGGAEALKG